MQNGASRMFHTIAAIAEENKLPGGDVSQRPQLDADPIAIVGLDVSNAFNCLRREALFEFLSKGCKAHLQGQSSLMFQLNLSVRVGTCFGTLCRLTMGSTASSSITRGGK
jgi:hypothetical protein